jgi:hypothetical protein
MTVAKEISKYKLDLVGVQEVRWTGMALDQQKNVPFSYGKEYENRGL